jgi:hypothetical protein
MENILRHPLSDVNPDENNTEGTSKIEDIVVEDDKKVEIKIDSKMAESKVYMDPSPTEIAWTKLRIKSIQADAAREALEEAVNSLQGDNKKEDKKEESKEGQGGIVDPTKFIKTDRIASKVVSKIPKLTGDDPSDPSFTWDDFLLKIQIASLNQSFDEGELKVILFQALEGNAQKYLAAHQ